MDLGDPIENPDDSLEALRKLLRDLGLPQDSDVDDDEVRADLFRNMMQRLVPGDGVSDESVIWETARQTARHVVSSLGPDPSGGSRVSRQVGDAVHLVELWLSEATVLPPVPMTPLAWSRAEWIEATMPSWRSMIEPVIATLAAGVNDATASRMEIDAMAEIAQLQSIIHPIMSRATGAMFGAHVGEGLGHSATTTMTGTDLGLPLLQGSQVVILPTNLSAIQQQAELKEEPLLLYCALREVSRQRLFHEIGWIAPAIIALVQHYAREMRVDPEAIATAMDSVVPEHLSAETVIAFQTDFSSILFSPQRSEEQLQILERLSTLLALVEGWVEDVTVSVTSRWLPDWEAISESLRRHRITSQPAQTVTPLIGASIDPKMIRQAAGFWESARLTQGVQARDEIWRHPDSMPGSADIANPGQFLSKPKTETDELDDELRRLMAADDEA